MSLIRQFFNDPMTSDMDTILANDPFFSSVARRDPFSALMRPMLTGSEFFSPRYLLLCFYDNG